jgi:hypothetical protein
MKLTIVTDEKGKIIATVSQPQREKGAPTMAQVAPRVGQRIHNLEVADSLSRREVVHKLHKTHIVEGTGPNAKLVESK